MRNRLIEIITRKSLVRGSEIQLTSGATSRFYFDMKPTVFDPEGAALISDLILAAVAGDPIDLVGGLEMGAVPIVANLAQRSFPDRPIPGFFVRKQPKGHGMRRLVEGVEAGFSFAGKRVLLVEDVTTTGGSVLKAVDVVREEGGEVVKIVTVVDRLEGAAESLGGQGLPLVPLVTADDFAL